MGSVVIVINPPCVDDEFGMGKAIEQMFIETLAPQPSIEAFNEAVLHWFARRNEVPGYAALLALFEHDV